jgi:hypothetical protein
MISVMREIWLDAWLTRCGLRVWMASSMIGKNDPPRYNVMLKILCLAKTWIWFRNDSCE